MLRRKRLQYGFHVSHLEVTRPDGLSVRIPWAEVNHGSGILVLPNAVRTAHPWLPRRLRLPTGVGQQQIRRLRVRSTAHALQDGSYDRFWVDTTSLGGVWRAVLIPGAITLLICIAALHYYRQYALDAGAAEADLPDPVLPTPFVVAIVACIVAAIVASVIGWMQERRLRVLAARATSAGLRRYLSNGQETYQTWSEATELKRGWDGKTLRLRMRSPILGSLLPPCSYGILQEALQRVLHPGTAPRRDHARDFRQACWGWLFIVLLFGGLLTLFLVLPEHDAADSLDVVRHREPVSFAKKLALCGLMEGLVICLFPAAIASDLGARRGLIRPLKKFFRDRFGRRRGKRAVGLQ
ncbi:MAG: hypothetical protein PVJ57_11685 [Phycisphaerae bacterium]